MSFRCETSGAEALRPYLAEQEHRVKLRRYARTFLDLDFRLAIDIRRVKGRRCKNAQCFVQSVLFP